MPYETQEHRLKKLIDECRAEQKAQEELFAKEKPLFLSVRSIALDTNPNLRLTPLMYAIKKCRRDKLVELLIDSGEGVNTKVPAAAMAAVHKGGDYGEVTPLIHAVRHENVQMVRQLVECGAIVDTQVAPGRTALMFAVRQQPGEHSELSDDAIEIAIFLTETTTKKERKRNSSREVNLDEAAPPETTRSDITLTTWTSKSAIVFAAEQAMDSLPLRDSRNDDDREKYKRHVALTHLLVERCARSATSDPPLLDKLWGASKFDRHGANIHKALDDAFFCGRVKVMHAVPRPPELRGRRCVEIYATLNSTSKLKAHEARDPLDDGIGELLLDGYVCDFDEASGIGKAQTLLNIIHVATAAKRWADYWWARAAARAVEAGGRDQDAPRGWGARPPAAPAAGDRREAAARRRRAEPPRGGDLDHRARVGAGVGAHGLAPEHAAGAVVLAAGYAVRHYIITTLTRWRWPPPARRARPASRRC